jgi:hypothetical protein
LHGRQARRQTDAIDIAEFRTVFGRGQIKALLDWSRLDEPAIRVEESFGDSRDRLGDLLSVWYVDAGGKPSEWRAADARPLSVREAADPGIAWPGERAHRLAAFEQHFATADEPIQLLLPAYAVGKGRTLLLDGTHRAVAAYRTGAPVALFIFTLRGPLDPAVLPDLRHYR